MRTADIEVGGEYRAQGGAKVKVLQVGVQRVRWSDRMDGIRVKFVPHGSGDARTKTIASRDIIRPWTAEDDAKREQQAARERAEEKLNDDLGALGFKTALATLSPRRANPGVVELTLRFKGTEAERVLAMLKAQR